MRLDNDSLYFTFSNSISYVHLLFHPSYLPLKAPFSSFHLRATVLQMVVKTSFGLLVLLLIDNISLTPRTETKKDEEEK
jgi:hypothetical protein